MNEKPKNQALIKKKSSLEFEKLQDIKHQHIFTLSGLQLHFEKLELEVIPVFGLLYYMQ